MKKQQFIKAFFIGGAGVIVFGLLLLGAILAWENNKGNDQKLLGVEYSSIVSTKPITEFLVEESKAEGTDRESARLYLYTQGISFVEELRKVDLKEGRNLINFQDVPRGVIPDSVFIRPVGIDPFMVIRQVFRDDLSNEQSFIQSLYGKDVTVVSLGGGSKESASGKLLGYNRGMVLETKDGVEVFGNPDRMIIHDIGPGYYSPSATLVLDASAPKSDEYSFNASYLTSDFSWKASYIAELSGEDINLTGWASIMNNSGVAYPRAKVTLVSGQPNVQANTAPLMRGIMENSVSFEKAVSSMISEPTTNFEYHLYALKEEIDFDNSKSQSLAFIRKPAVKAKKLYVFENGTVNKKPLSVNLKLENLEENGLGISLPGGTVRFYSNTKDGTLFIGEAYIPQFNKGDEEELFIGQAMDILGERVVVNRDVKSEIISLGKNCTEENIKLTITNKSDGMKPVLIKERIPGREVRIKSINVDTYEKVDENNIEVMLNVEADSEVGVKYGVEYCY